MQASCCFIKFFHQGYFAHSLSLFKKNCFCSNWWQLTFVYMTIIENRTPCSGSPNKKMKLEYEDGVSNHSDFSNDSQNSQISTSTDFITTIVTSTYLQTSASSVSWIFSIVFPSSCQYVVRGDQNVAQICVKFINSLRLCLNIM